MLTTVGILVVLVSIALGVPLVFWSLEVLIGASVPFKLRAHGTSGVRVAVLIPAHDEQAGLGATLDGLRGQLGPDDSVLVVADNCTDETARIAREAGVEVTERTDTNHRGKGYALEHGVRELERLGLEPEVVVIFDADCAFLGAGQLRALADEALRLDRPIQAAYTLEPPEQARIEDRVSAFAIAVKNIIRPLGLARLGGPCLLTGTGMAVPFGQLRRVALASGDIVEDMRLAVDLSLDGVPAKMSRTAAVVSTLPGSDAGRASQRQRWEQGHVRSIVAHVPRLLAGSLRRPTLAMLAMELAVPPFSLLMLLAAAWFMIVGALAVTGLAPPAIAWINAGTAGLVAAATITAWARVGRRHLPAAQLAAIPWWVIRKIPIYLGLARGGQKEWIRTDRGANGARQP